MRYTAHHRSNRYWAFRHEHFTVGEAKQLSQLRRLDYYELRPMVKERRALWSFFDNIATDNGWGGRKRSREWKEMVKEWYVSRGHVEKDFLWFKRLQPHNVWFWFDDVSSRLPEEKRYSNDVSRARKKTMSPKERVHKASHEEQQALHQRAIDGLMKRVTPESDKRWTEAAAGFGFTGKSLYMTAVRRGFIDKRGTRV